MATPSEIAARSRRLVIILSVTVAALVLVLVATIVVLTRDSGGQEPAADPSPSPSTSAGIGPDGTLRLPPSSDTVEGGLPVGFEHSPEGAVAMTTAFSMHDVTVDPERKARALIAYGAGQQNEQVEETAAAYEDSILRELERWNVEVDNLAELPDQASVSAMPVGAVYEPVDETTTDVAVLSVVHVNDGINGQQRYLDVATMRAQWDAGLRGGDWAVALEDFPELSAPEEAEPGTTEFENSEWIPMQVEGVPE